MFASFPLCCPSRATYLTGQYRTTTACSATARQGGSGAFTDPRTRLPGCAPAGYDTAHIGKYLNGYGRDEGATVPPGWSDWQGPSTRRPT